MAGKKVRTGRGVGFTLLLRPGLPIILLYIPVIIEIISGGCSKYTIGFYVYLILINLISVFKVSTINPGFVRPSNILKYSSEPLILDNQLHLKPEMKTEFPIEIRTIFESGIREIIFKIDNCHHVYIEKFCSACNIYRPYKMSHCSDCRHCVHEKDHHCQFLNNCVGRNNLRYFLFLLLSSSVLIYIGIKFIEQYILNSVNICVKIIKTIVNVISVVAPMVPLGFSIYYVFLSLCGKTSREFINMPVVDLKKFSLVSAVLGTIIYRPQIMCNE